MVLAAHFHESRSVIRLSAESGPPVRMKKEGGHFLFPTTRHFRSPATPSANGGCPGSTLFEKGFGVGNCLKPPDARDEEGGHSCPPVNVWQKEGCGRVFESPRSRFFFYPFAGDKSVPPPQLPRRLFEWGLACGHRPDGTRPTVASHGALPLKLTRMLPNLVPNPELDMPGILPDNPQK
jgi:hypothetical protein